MLTRSSVGYCCSDSVTEDGLTGNFYLDLNENGTANLPSKEPEP